MRDFDVPDTEAAAVRLVTLENQCTGGPDYAGEQDDDPLNDTDCATALRPRHDRARRRAAGLHHRLRHPRGRRHGHRREHRPRDRGRYRRHRNGTGTGTGSTPSTGGSTSGPPARVGTSIRLRIRRAAQTSANPAPVLRARLRLDGARAERLGRWVVTVDGRRYASSRVDRLTLRLRVSRPLAPGTHRVRVAFRPADRTAFAPSRSALARIVVRR